MSTAGLAKVTAKLAADICKQFELGEAAQELPQGNLAPRQFLDVLMQKSLNIDAIRFLAYAMPKQETIWWAIQCARAGIGANPHPKAVAALAAAEKWVVDPKDDHRWAAKAAAEVAGMDKPAGLAAMSAFWSGGSITPAGQHQVPAPEHLTALMAAGAVMMSAVVTEAEKAPEKFKKFLNMGIDVANGTNKWK